MAQHGGDLLVDPRLADDALGHDMLGMAEQQRAQLQGIDAEVKQASASEVGAIEPVIGIERQREAEVGLHQVQLADAARADDIHQGAVRRKEPAPDSLHEEQAPGAGILHHVLHLGGVEGAGLLTEDVLAGTQVQACIRRVTRLRGGHVHHLHVRVFGQGGVVAVPGGHTEAIGERIRTRARTRGHGDDLATVHALHRLGKIGCDPPGTDHTPPNHVVDPLPVGHGRPDPATLSSVTLPPTRNGVRRRGTEEEPA